MIKKSFQINKLIISKYKIFLLYGKNYGLQNDIVNDFFLKDFNGDIIRYDENDAIIQYDNIISECQNKSLFNEEKLIIISRVTDKILKLINDVVDRNIDKIKIILKATVLDKKSKLRNLFEKSNELLTIPVYEDSLKALSYLVGRFINENKIKISKESTNLIIERARGDRENLKIELNKLLNYSTTNKSIDYDTIKKLSNLAENYTVNELSDAYLCKNKKRISKIINENNYNNEDCILVLRTILGKSKRLIEILDCLKETKNIDKVLSNIKPPIFWKEKDNVKVQVNNWKLEDLKHKVYKINNLELLLKNNPNSSLNILSDFIFNF